MNRKNLRISASLAIIAIAIAWITIIISIILNPWFRINANALSDLGGGNFPINGHPAPLDPWVFNTGLIVTGIMIMLFSIYSETFVSSKIENTGLSFFVISGLFLLLIGVYHEGTYPHDFVSIWFFILASISYFTIGISLLFQLKKFGILMVIVIVASWFVYALVKWQSVAEGEIFGVIIIDFMVILHILSMRIRMLNYSS